MADKNYISRGMKEKGEIGKNLITKKKQEIKRFFSDYHVFVKTSEDRSILFKLLKSSLMKGLTQEEKLSIVSDVIPIEKLQSLHQDLSIALNLNENSSHSELSTQTSHSSNPSNLSIMNNYIQNPTQNNYPQNLAQNVFYMQSYPNEIMNSYPNQYQQIIPMNQDMFNPEDCITRCSQQHVQKVPNQDVDLSPKTHSDIEDDDSVLSHDDATQNIPQNDVENKYLKLKELIIGNEDIEKVIRKLEDTDMRDMVLNYIPINDEPLLFHMASTFRSKPPSNYKPVLSKLLKQNLLSLKIVNLHNYSVFHYLLKKDFDQLIEFLHFMKEQSLQEKIQRLCLNDNFFNVTLSTLEKNHAKDVKSVKLKKIREFCLPVNMNS